MTAARPIASVQIPEVPLALLRESFANPRKSFDPAAQAELVESIRQHGIQSPLIVRVFPDSALHSVKDTSAVKAGELFEIVCGHWEKTIKTAAVNSVAFARAAAVVLLEDEDANYLAHPDGYGKAEDGRPELLKLLRVFGYDGAKHWQEKPANAAAKAQKKAPAKKAAKKGGRK